MRGIDVVVCAMLGTVLAATEWITAGTGMAFPVTFAATAACLAFSALLVRKHGSALITALVGGLLSLGLPGITGAGFYSMSLAFVSGISFEAIWALRKKFTFIALAGVAAAVVLPPTLWAVVGGGPQLAEAVANLTVLAALAGIAGTALAFVIWEEVAHTKTVIRFEVIENLPAGATRKRKRVRKRR